MSKLIKQIYNFDTGKWEDDGEITPEEVEEYRKIELSLEDQGQTELFAQVCSDLYLMQMALEDFPDSTMEILTRTNMARA